jgi:hypothetical protein
MPRARKTNAPKRPTRSDVEANLGMMDRIGLMALIRDLYNLNALNRRALHASHRTRRRSISIVVLSERRSFPAADLGYRDEAYFTALEHKVNQIVRLLNEVPNSERRALTERIARLGAYQGAIGWGYGDFLADVAAKVAAREDRSSRPRSRRNRQSDGRAG